MEEVQAYYPGLATRLARSPARTAPPVTDARTALLPRAQLTGDWDRTGAHAAIVETARRRRAAALLGRLASTEVTLSARLGIGALAVLAAIGIAAIAAPGVNLAAPAIVFAAAAVSSVGGFAFSAICGASLFHLMTPVAAVELMMVCSIAIQAMSVVALRRAIEWRLLGRFLVGGIATLPLGVWLLMRLDPTIYCRLLGAFLVGYGAFMLVRPRIVSRERPGWADCVAGMLGGITGGLAGFPGAFVTIWCARRGLPKDRQRGAYQPFILAMQVLALAMISAAAAGAPAHAPLYGFDDAFCVPAAVLGTWCGLAWYRRLNEVQFALAVNLLLIVSGIALAL